MLIGSHTGVTYYVREERTTRGKLDSRTRHVITDYGRMKKCVAKLRATTKRRVRVYIETVEILDNI